MHVLIVYAHPETRSFNGALRDAARDAFRAAGNSVQMSDLYREGFDPVERAEFYHDRREWARFVTLDEQRHAGRLGLLPSSVDREIERIKAADLIVLQFPLWWHAQPAILKGWFDRVFVNGAVYTSRMRYDRGIFRGKRAILSVTTGAPEAAFEPGGRGGDIQRLLWPIQYSLYYVGFSVLSPFLAYGVAGQGYRYEDDELKATRLGLVLREWTDRLVGLDVEEPLRFPGWDDWDEEGRLKAKGEPAANSRAGASC